jgi:hypothetical protein
MRVNSIQNNTNFKGLITVYNFNRLSDDLQAKVSTALGTNHAYRTAQSGRFFGEDKFLPEQRQALNALGVQADFKAGSINKLFQHKSPF